VRCRHHSIETQQRVVHGRLLHEHIEGRTGNNPRQDRIVQVLLIDDAPTRTVEDENSLSSSC